MSEYQTKEIANKQVWEKYVLSRQPRSFLQSWNWGETNILIGDKVIRLGYYDGKKLLGVCQLIDQKAKRGPHFLVPGGPIIDWSDKKLVETFARSIRDLAQKESAWFVRIRPELLDNDSNVAKIRALGFVPAPMHLHTENTYVLDLRKSDDEILMGMRKNTRYGVRRSLKEGWTLLKSKDPTDAKILYDLQKETIERNKFIGFSERFFRAQVEAFAKDDQAKMFLVKKDKEVYVAAIIIFYGDYAFYHHSGSSHKARNGYASYFLQWQIIQEAKRMGCKFYDLWGAVPKGRTKHRFAGPSLFKKGFGGEQIDWIHTHDLPTHPLYWTTFLFETTRRMMRGL